MQVIFPGVDFLGTALKFKKREENLDVACLYPQLNVNLGIFTS